MTDQERLERHNQLMADLRNRGTSFSKVARTIGMSPASITQVSKRRQRSELVIRALAEAVEKPPQELFPEYFEGGAEEKT